MPGVCVKIQEIPIMTQFAFGSGTLIGKRTDVTGLPPCLLGTLQDVSLDFDRKIETLLGQYNMAVAAGGGEFKAPARPSLPACRPPRSTICSSARH